MSYGLNYFSFVPGIQNSVSAASLAVYLAVLANCGSMYLAYILYFILDDFCVVCVSTYVINFGLLLVTIFRKKFLVNVYQRKQFKKKK